MQLVKFSVTNYKVFKETFSIDLSVNSIAILTGRNNTGKSTILEAIDCFFRNETASKSIPSNCFSTESENITMEAVFIEEDNEIKIIKEYEREKKPKYYDEAKAEIRADHGLKEKLDSLQNNKPFYITPSMLPDDIHDLIQNIYSEIIKNDLNKLENVDDDDSQELIQLAEEYENIKSAYPIFIQKLKENTDSILKNVSSDVTNDLKTLFSNEHLSLNVIGGETSGFSSSDLLKTTASTVHINNHHQNEMPLANQGTGLQRMSLIYLIQNMIQNRLMGDQDNKLLLIDEPEAFLHPEAIRALSRSLYKIGSRMPLMISTHSPILIDLSESHTSIQVFRIGNKEAIQLYKTQAQQFEEEDVANMKILNYVDSYVNEFFFADKILIVEGDTEYIAFKHYAKEAQENIHIVRARGKSTIVTLMKILNQFNTSYDVIHDVDNNEGYKLQTLKAQLTNCKNIYNQKTHDEIRIFASISNFENAIGLEDVSSNQKTKNIYQIIHGTDGPGSGSDDFSSARNEIENIFNCIVKRETEEPSGNFQLITSESDYDDLFREIIERKEQEETSQQTN